MGNSALHLAACQREREICCMLCSHGTSKNIINQDGQTAMDIAKQKNYTEIITSFEDPALQASEHHNSEDLKPPSCDRKLVVSQNVSHMMLSNEKECTSNDNTKSVEVEKLQEKDEKKRNKREKKEKGCQMQETKGQKEKGSTKTKKWWQIYRASTRFNSKGIGLSAQKKILAKIGSRSNAKIFINDNMAEMLDNVYHLCKGYTKSKEEAEKIMKNIIKVTIKVGVLFQNGQFNQQELVLADKFTKEFHLTILTFVSFYEVDFTFDNDYLAKRINDCCSVLTQLVGRHLTKKSTDRIRSVFKFFSDDSFLNDFLETLFKTDCPLQNQLDNVVGGLHRLIENGDI